MRSHPILNMLLGLLQGCSFHQHKSVMLMKWRYVFLGKEQRKKETQRGALDQAAQCAMR
jgi:hypothetical protein